jgi:diguanylate cyclase (GGDEF)-like protein/PAS domain S-box-containing protein
MRHPILISRHFVTVMAILIAAAAAAAAVRLGLMPDNPDHFVLGSLVAICLISAVTALLTFRQATVLELLASEGHRLTADKTPAPQKYADDLGRLAESLRSMGRKRRRNKLSSEDLNGVFDTLNDAVILTDKDGAIEHVNSSAVELLGYGRDDLIGVPIGGLVAPRFAEDFTLANDKRTFEAALVNSSQNEIPVSYSCSRIDAGDFAAKGFVIVARNIAERKIAEKRIRYLAKIDALTKIPNRMQFQHLLQRLIARARRNRTQIALLYFDVDRFKDINDTFGHTAGDTCLEALASRVTRVMPREAICGRLAGDEFAVAIEWQRPAAEFPAYLQSLIKKLRKDLGKVLIVQGHEIHMDISVGIACYPKDGDNVLDLIRNADAALYHAKRDQQNHFEFFDPKMHTASVERLMLKSKLRRSFELDELLVHYQPKYDIKTGLVVGAEALVRWELTDHGMVLPSDFIPLAEETNLIVQIGEWVLNQVCKDLSDWQHRMPGTGKVAVNLSLKQLAQRNFTKRISRIMKRHNISPQALELEITESTMMRDPEATIRILRELDQLGLSLSIDDFGTGYSSLSALQKFPISTLKIDKSFIHDILVNKDGTTIVSAIIDLAHSMNMDVVAEGVESETQLSYLKAQNCDLVQGLLFGGPMSASDYFRLLIANGHPDASTRELFTAANRDSLRAVSQKNI